MSLLRALEKPRCIIARTVKGHGISYMANRVEWHYLSMQDEQYAQALIESAALQWIARRCQ